MKKCIALIVMLLFQGNTIWCISETSKKYRVLVIWNCAGEYEWAKRIEQACERLGWDVSLSLSTLSRLAFFDEQTKGDIQRTYPPQYAIQTFKPDFTISLKDAKVFTSKIPNYMVIDTLFEGFFNKNFLPFDGFLQVFSTESFLKPYIEASGKTFHVAYWYPSCIATEYQPVQPKKIFFCGFLWDGKRSSEEYKKLFSLLDMWGYLSVYGPQETWSFIPNSYQGLLPFDGKSIGEAIKKAGISLILHAYCHLLSSAPTARNF